MLEPTKKPHTEEVNLCFTGPATRKKEALQAMRELGFKEADASMPWREALGYDDDQLPGVFLAGARYREGLTQVQLAERSGIPRRHISEMENNKRPIGKNNARKLADVLGIDPRRLLAI